MTRPILYSYRRCPYAMRARMALVVSGVQAQVHEVDFKNKPAAMLEISPKGTVPVLQTSDGNVIDESLDIMHWALAQNDPQEWLDCDRVETSSLIAENDGAFKAALDRYKYPNRFPDEDCSGAREQGTLFLEKLNKKIEKEGQLMGEAVSLADIAIFPFIRQFANVDSAWSGAQDFSALRGWLSSHVESPIFQGVFQKQKGNIYSLIN